MEELIEVTPPYFYRTYNMAGEVAQKVMDRELSPTYLGNLGAGAELEAQLPQQQADATQGELNG